jgi:hypothetical protein
MDGWMDLKPVCLHCVIFISVSIVIILFLSIIDAHTSQELSLEQAQGLGRKDQLFVNPHVTFTTLGGNPDEVCLSCIYMYVCMYL